MTCSVPQLIGMSCFMQPRYRVACFLAFLFACFFFYSSKSLNYSILWWHSITLEVGIAPLGQKASSIHPELEPTEKNGSSDSPLKMTECQNTIELFSPSFSVKSDLWPINSLHCVLHVTKITGGQRFGLSSLWEAFPNLWASVHRTH